MRPEPPDVANVEWCSSPIDRFILARLEHEQLVPQPPADRRALLRRVTFDLTGLPPTPAEIGGLSWPTNRRRPTSASSIGCWPRPATASVGRSIGSTWRASPRPTASSTTRCEPQAWRYRDWVIEALNDDLPSIEFIQLQIAGDELRPDDPQAAIATGFLLAGPDMPDINLKEERRHMVLNEITSTVGSVLLGLQLGCAQCHDHKYDPISQADFYRLRAVFEAADVFGGSPEGRVLQEKQSGARQPCDAPRRFSPAGADRGAGLSADRESVGRQNFHRCRGEADCGEECRGDQRSGRRTALAPLADAARIIR